MSPVSNAPIASYVMAQTEVILNRRSDVRVNGPDAVHATRVACRRLRSTLRTFHPLWLTRHHGLLRDLRWYGRQLAAPRDTEVIEEALLDLAARIDDAGTAFLGARLRAKLDGDRDLGLANLHLAMDGPRFSRLIERVQRLALTDEWDPLSDVPADRLLPALAYAPVVQVIRHAEALPESGPTRLVALHELRKKAKAARYAYEAIGPQTAGAAVQWKRVTESLGKAQDGHVGEHLLSSLEREASQAGEPLSPYAAMRSMLFDDIEHGEREGLEALRTAIAEVP